MRIQNSILNNKFSLSFAASSAANNQAILPQSNKMATEEPTKQTTPGRRKRRWGDGPNSADADNSSSAEPSKKKSTAPQPTKSENISNGKVATTTTNTDPKSRAAALQASIQARLAALKARTSAGVSKPPPTTKQLPPPPPQVNTIQKRPLDTTSSSQSTTTNNDTQQPQSKRAKVFELDLSSTTSTRLLEKQQHEEQLRIESTKAKINPYLAHTITTTQPVVQQKPKDKKSIVAAAKAKGALPKSQPEEEEVILDTRLSNPSKNRLKSRPINFVTPGTYIALGEKKRAQAELAKQSGFISGRKVGNVVKSVGMGYGASGDNNEGGMNNTNYYGQSEAGTTNQTIASRYDAPDIQLEDYLPKKKILTSIEDVNVETNNVAINAAISAAVYNSMPYAMEWWDAELLPSKLRKELVSEEKKAIISKNKKKSMVVDKQQQQQQQAASEGKEEENTIQQQYQSQREVHNQLIQKCYNTASLSNTKTYKLQQHPIPILTPQQKLAKEALKNKPPTLHLTKAERKRHRKLRRAERLREQQDLQAAGLVPPPEPRLTLSNYMKVLGDQAILDPSKMEAVVMTQIQQRKLKHDKMNADRKLTKEEKSAKHARKLYEDTSQSVSVALFYVKDMSHPYHRAKVDLNAQQNDITGGVLECDEYNNSSGDNGENNEGGGGGMALVVAEGGEKAIKRYIRLMTVRMKWKGEDFYEEEPEEEEEEEEELMIGEDDELDEQGQPIKKKEKKEKRKKFNPNNECELIWNGMVMKRSFHTFMFQNAESSGVARKILEVKGVPHYWDLCCGHLERKMGIVGGGGDQGGEEVIKFRLG